MKTYITITDQFEGIHCWPNAPDEVWFLRLPHRHMFHVKATIQVSHDDRELEFILVKRFLKSCYPAGDLGSLSCEQIAKNLIGRLELRYGLRSIELSVSEDGENGAVVRNCR